MVLQLPGPTTVGPPPLPLLVVALVSRRRNQVACVLLGAAEGVTAATKSPSTCRRYRQYKQYRQFENTMAVVDPANAMAGHKTVAAAHNPR